MALSKCMFRFYESDGTVTEEYTFPFNPSKSILPIAQPRASASYYNVQNRAFVEDGKIEISNEYAPREMVDEIENFVDTNLLPFDFIDHLEREYLVTFDTFEKYSPHKAMDLNYYGFRIIMSLVVLN